MSAPQKQLKYSLFALFVCLFVVENKPKGLNRPERKIACMKHIVSGDTPSVPGGPGNTQAFLCKLKSHFMDIGKSSALGEKKRKPISSYMNSL